MTEPDMKRETLTTEQALALLPDGDRIHTFRGGGGLMLGADWDRPELEQCIRDNECELSGPAATSMGHGLFVHDGRGLFVDTRKDDARWHPMAPEITRLDLPTGRVYEGDAGQLPSVTRILRDTMPDEDRQRLDDWMDRVGHVEAERIRQQGADRGTALHTEVEMYLSHGLPGESPWFKSIQWVVDTHERPLAIERPVYCARLGYAGTPDLIGHRGEFRAIFDWTTSGKPKKGEYLRDKFLQCAAYAIAWEDAGGDKIEELIIGVALEDRPGQLFTAVLSEVDEYREEWMRRLAQYKEAA